MHVHQEGLTAHSGDMNTVQYQNHMLNHTLTTLQILHTKSVISLTCFSVKLLELPALIAGIPALCS